MAEKPYLSFSIERILGSDLSPKPTFIPKTPSDFLSVLTEVVVRETPKKEIIPVTQMIDEKMMLRISRFGGYATLSLTDYYKNDPEDTFNSNEELYYSTSAYLNTHRRTRRRFYRGGQVRFESNQTQKLEEVFQNQRYLSPDQRKNLAISLGLSERQVKTWFQNRRAKCRRTSKETPIGSSPRSLESDDTDD
ncbi:hematopoietically-expressed homeobox protein hhex-like [Artemia franciscana]|uniref:Homeobox domain-containing protein n=1 Tax=Artemia franciscana TaxID=6661 RepID=A0AA88HJA2_ARTSF|nr:hypothetical protein QYM36_013860 [Artemia franciscana]